MAARDIDSLEHPGEEGREGRDEVIYRRLVDAIVDHRLAPGARLTEDGLGDVFGVSRTGIRKVLHRLELEHLVTTRRHRGAQVARPSREEARDVFSARRMVEAGSMPAVIERFRPEHRSALGDLVEQERKARAEDRHQHAIRYSAAFHVRLIGVAGNDTITGFVRQLTSRSSLIIAVYGSRQSVGCDCGEHADLLGLVADGDTGRARSWMERHLERIEASLDFRALDDRTPDLHAIFGPAAGQ